MNHEPMTVGDASAFARGLVNYWPQPELGHNGLPLLAQTLAETGLPADAVEAAIRELRRTHGQFRPTVADVVALARQHIAPARRPAALPAPGEVSKRDAYRHLAECVGAAMRGRESMEARIGKRIATTESGSMRHISSALAIGPVTITGTEPLASELAAELLHRHDQPAA